MSGAFSGRSHSSSRRSRHGRRTRRPPPSRAPAQAMGHPRERRHRPAGRQRHPHRPHVGPPRWPRRARLPGRDPHRHRPGQRAAGHVPRARPARPDGPQPVARRGLRDGPPRVVAPLAGVHDRVAHRGARRVHHRRLRGHRWRVDRRRDDHHRRHLPVRAVERRRVRAVRDGRRDLDALRPSAPVVRDVVRPPPLRLPRDRARIPPPAVHRGGLHPRPGRGLLLDLALRADRGARAHVPLRTARADLVAPPAARVRGRARGTGRRLDLHRRPRPRPARRPLRPVLRVPLPDPRRLVARPPVLAELGAQRQLAPDHGQGAGRSHRRPRRGARSAPVSSSKARTASSPARDGPGRR